MCVYPYVCTSIHHTFVWLIRIFQTGTHAGHCCQHLRQVREPHRDIGQALGHGAAHDAEDVHRARRGVLLARPQLPKHVGADYDADLQPLVVLGCFSWRRVLGVALCFCSRREIMSVAMWMLQPLSRRCDCTRRGRARRAPGRTSSPRIKTQALGRG